MSEIVCGGKTSSSASHIRILFWTASLFSSLSQTTIRLVFLCLRYNNVIFCHGINSTTLGDLFFLSFFPEAPYRLMQQIERASPHLLVQWFTFSSLGIITHLPSLTSLVYRHRQTDTVCLILFGLNAVAIFGNIHKYTNKGLYTRALCCKPKQVDEYLSLCYYANRPVARVTKNRSADRGIFCLLGNQSWERSVGGRHFLYLEMGPNQMSNLAISFFSLAHCVSCGVTPAIQLSRLTPTPRFLRTCQSGFSLGFTNKAALVMP